MNSVLRHWPPMLYVSGLSLQVGLGTYVLLNNPALLVEIAESVTQVADNIRSAMHSLRVSVQEILRVMGV